jgi:hypothetical protein
VFVTVEVVGITASVCVTPSSRTCPDVAAALVTTVIETGKHPDFVAIRMKLV